MSGSLRRERASDTETTTATYDGGTIPVDAPPDVGSVVLEAVASSFGHGNSELMSATYTFVP